jgi:hypothetical protein
MLNLFMQDRQSQVVSALVLAGGLIADIGKANDRGIVRRFRRTT